MVLVSVVAVTVATSGPLLGLAPAVEGIRGDQLAKLDTKCFCRPLAVFEALESIDSAVPRFEHALEVLDGAST